jgi:hypothetical protein
MKYSTGEQSKKATILTIITRTFVLFPSFNLSMLVHNKNKPNINPSIQKATEKKDNHNTVLTS